MHVETVAALHSCSGGGRPGGIISRKPEDLDRGLVWPAEESPVKLRSVGALLVVLEDAGKDVLRAPRFDLA